MPGFPRAEQRLLAFLISSQRHQINLRHLKRLPNSWRERALRLAMLLRLAVLLCRSRGNLELPKLEIEVTEKSLELRFNSGWLKAYPLAIADLERERGDLSDVGYELIVS